MAPDVAVIELKASSIEYDTVFCGMYAAYLSEEFCFRLPDSHADTLFLELRDELRRGHILIHLLYAAETPAGFCVSLPDSPERPSAILPGFGFIRDFYIRPGFRRRRFGTAFYLRLRECCRLSGRKGFYLISTPEAAPFWHGLGFRPMVSSDPISSEFLLFHRFNEV